MKFAPSSLVDHIKKNSRENKEHTKRPERKPEIGKTYKERPKNKNSGEEKTRAKKKKKKNNSFWKKRRRNGARPSLSCNLGDFRPNLLYIQQNNPLFPLSPPPNHAPPSTTWFPVFTWRTEQYSKKQRKQH